MILQSLVAYYEALAAKGEITRPGWCSARVAFALELDREGTLKRIIPLKQEVLRGKKTVLVSQDMTVPQMVTRSSGEASNFLCDNSSYFLGVDNKGKPARSLKCFACAAEKHRQILKDVDSPAARAVVRFFDTWKPEGGEGNAALAGDWEEIVAGANLVFWVDNGYVHEDEAVREAWNKLQGQPGEGDMGVCLVTGERTQIARIHGQLKGIQGAQSSGAALVSFNAPAFESYGKEQSYNAPVGTYAVYAYTTALNHLIADKNHRTMIGDTTVVYWAEDAQEIYQNVFACISEPSADNQELVNGVFKNLEKGRAVVADDVSAQLNMDQRFFILGLAPNAARISVRFYYQDSFGNILRHIKEHYDRMEIVKPAADSLEYLGIWRMLQETVNMKSRDKKPVVSLPGAVYRAMLSGGRYPALLYEAVLGRIRAVQDDKDSHTYKITRGRAAIIKAYLLRNTNLPKEEITMALKEDSSNVAYTLGREFAVLEDIQRKANPDINATIKDRYFNSACATPASIFPILFRLKNSHIRKIKNEGAVISFEKQLTELQGKLDVTNGQTGACPRRLTLEEQGMFILGYYHQTQKIFEKKVKEEQENG